MIDFADLFAAAPYFGYSYAYPHKSAYRSLAPSIPLAEAWSKEATDSLFVYLHVPFCEFRCGFCNLFTLANADIGWVTRYLTQLRAEATAMADILPAARYSQVAIGGGTPTFLSESQLADLLSIASQLLGGPATGQPACCEASPATLTPEKARLLRDWGIDRLSLGVQSFDDSESRGLGRPQRSGDVDRAIEITRQHDFPILNLDLIYGSEGQSLRSWLATVDRAITYLPEEIYLYPLYVRDLTGLGRTGHHAGDDRLDHYRAGRDQLLAAGYEQTSMRMFRRPVPADRHSPTYSCQNDGMVGLGCGARSYTRELHYSSEFAVGRRGVRSILHDYLKRDPKSFYFAYHGFELDGDEQRRRFVIQGLLQCEGLSLGHYQRRSGADLLEDFPSLAELTTCGFAELSEDLLRLTSEGVARSDAIGPWLYSPRVVELMEAFECV